MRSLLGTYRRLAAAIALSALLAGVASASADVFQHYSRHESSSQTPQCHKKGSSTPHIVRETETQKLPLCNACFFRNLLGHSLVTVWLQTVPANRSTFLIQTQRSYPAAPACFDGDSRGPPQSGISDLVY